MDERLNGLLAKGIVVAFAAVASIVMSETAAAQPGSACFDRCYGNCMQRIPSRGGGFNNKTCSQQCSMRCAGGQGQGQGQGQGRRSR
jgi:hypothetical protein